MATEDIQHHVAPEIVINRDCPPEKRIILLKEAP
jgi:hypothetical protein